ncbi:MAG: peptidoglycan-binding protein [Nocardioidaceae bacterium]
MERTRSRTRWTLVLAASALVACALAGGAFLFYDRHDGRDGATTTPGDYQVLAVRKRTLTVGSSINGKIGYGPPRALPIRASGTVTWLPVSGSVLNRDGVVMRVDNRPVVLMYGTTPAYRALYDTGAETSTKPSHPDGQKASDSSAPTPLSGPDVEQLENNLAALGYTGFDVDQEFTTNTAEAVKAWQRDLEVPVTGRVELGDVLFLPGPIRVVADASTLGTDAPAAAVQQTSTQKVVTAQAPADSLGWADKGVKVKVTLPDQRSTKAMVTDVGSTADAGGNVTLRLALASPAQAPRSGTVTISYVAQRRRDVLTVPVTALVALAEGGYGVQLDDAAGTFVPVEPGLYADGDVEISGDISAGTKIRVPR